MRVQQPVLCIPRTTLKYLDPRDLDTSHSSKLKSSKIDIQNSTRVLTKNFGMGINRLNQAIGESILHKIPYPGQFLSEKNMLEKSTEFSIKIKLLSMLTIPSKKKLVSFPIKNKKFFNSELLAKWKFQINKRKTIFASKITITKINRPKNMTTLEIPKKIKKLSQKPFLRARWSNYRLNAVLFIVQKWKNFRASNFRRTRKN